MRPGALDLDYLFDKRPKVPQPVFADDALVLLEQDISHCISLVPLDGGYSVTWATRD